ncbi:hypothetical protein NNO07_27545 [Pseudomonas resinovorans]|uniref:Uncharacterized protein n=1 Tax=Metapseudomonas resinovorans TaxID=53412 RepID=A0ABT4YD45_METRE|nr:hypothetical protein [Pseudomonas resinovorans]MDA8486830.1 hypothetical protein [Pseudomonas resinovorans]
MNELFGLIGGADPLIALIEDEQIAGIPFGEANPQALAVVGGQGVMEVGRTMSMM